MKQKYRIEYAVPKYGPAGTIIPNQIIVTEAKDRETLSVANSSPTNYALNVLSGLARIISITNGVFVALKQNVDKTYTKATGTLTLIGAIVPGSHAESIVTANTIVDGSSITIGDTTYVFKTALSTEPTVPYEVLIGAGDAEALDNLKLAINGGTGEGTNYSYGTVAHPDVVATTNGSTTQKVVARVPGVAANDIATTSINATLAWEDTTLGGGTGDSNPGVDPETVTIGTKTYSFVDVLSETNGATAIANQVLFGATSAEALDNLKLAVNHGATEGTNYSTGTVAHTQVSATTNADDSQVFEALSSGSSYNSVATTTTIANGAFGETTLTGGDSATFDFYIPAGGTLDIPIEETVTNLSFIGDAGTATVVITEY